MDVLQIVEMVVYEMEHIGKHISTKEGSIEVDGLNQRSGTFVLCSCFMNLEERILLYYSVYYNDRYLPWMSSTTSSSVSNLIDYTELDIERLLKDEGYRFQVGCMYNEMELIHHIRSTVFARDFAGVAGVGGINFGELNLLDKVQKYKELELSSEWKIARGTL